MKKPDTLPIIAFATQQDWANWLHEHATDPAGVWVKVAKKDTGIASITHAEALEIALCYGWIDGQGAKFDEQYWLQKFTPRRPKSVWSQVNCAKVEQLLADGKMQPTGIEQMERAKADGRWAAAYASQSTATVPDDLQAALDQNPQALAFFATLNSVNRYAILYRIQAVKKPETRAAKIKQFVEMLAR